MTTFFVATVTRYVLVDAEDETEARQLGYAASYDLHADVRERLGEEVPINIHTLRAATDAEVQLWRWHHETLAREAAIKNP